MDQLCRDLLADCRSILARWRNNFSQILNIRSFNDVRLNKIRSAEPLVPEPSAFEVEMAVEDLRR
jgi:hypothetical protein